MICDLVIAFIYISNLFDSNMAMIVLFVGLSYTYLGTKMTVWTVKKRRRFNKAWVRQHIIRSFGLATLTLTFLAVRIQNPKRSDSQLVDSLPLQ